MDASWSFSPASRSRFTRAITSSRSDPTVGHTDVENFLGAIGITAGEYGRSDALCEKGVFEVLKTIHNRDGLAVLLVHPPSAIEAQPLEYFWTQTGGPAVELSAQETVTTTFTTPFDTVMLTFTLVVTDSLGLVSDPDEVAITVGLYDIYLPLVLRQ